MEVQDFSEIDEGRDEPVNGGAVLRSGVREVSPAEMVQAYMSAQRQVTTARYYVHAMRVHQYVMAVAQGLMPREVARAKYDEAMRNFDGIMHGAVGGRSLAANLMEVAKGAEAIDERLDELEARAAAPDTSPAEDAG